MASTSKKTSTKTSTKSTSKIDLKGNNAGYATRNAKTGAVTYYKKASDAPGYSDTATGKGVKTSPGNPMYTKDASGNVITPEKLVTAPTPALPPVQQVNNVGDVVTPGNVGLATSIQGATIKDGQFVLPQLSEPTSSSDTTGLQQNMQSYLSNLLGNKPVDNEALYKKTEKEVGLNKAQKEVNNYTSQLNAITASSQAQQLALEGQGRGQTSGFIGGEQARINREAAIAALPVQAQLATAQGNLEFAQQRLDTLFKIRSADAQAKYDFTNKIFSTYYDFANTIQKSKMDALKVKEDRAYAEKQQSIADAKNIAMQAIEYGQSSLASRIMGLDHDSPTYAQDVASAWGQLRKPSTTTQKAPTIQTINGVDMQWDPTTGTWVTPTGAGAAGTTPMSSQKTQTLNDIDTLLQNSESKLSEFLGKRNIIQRNIPGTEEYQFSVQHDNLINQLALAARGELKGQGQVSDYEGKLLKSAQTTLNLYMEPKAYLKEAKQVRGAIQTSSGIPAYVSIKSQDGSQTKYAVLDSQSIQDAVNQGYVVEYQ